MLPKDNESPATTYEAKQVVCPLGLEIQKIHACPNDYILYHGEEYEKLVACPVCHASWYKIRRDDPGDVEGERPKKKILTKVMWYAPIIPCLKCLFRNRDHAKLLRWHKEDRKVDNILRHPADGSQWRAIDRKAVALPRRYQIKGTQDCASLWMTSLNLVQHVSYTFRRGIPQSRWLSVLLILSTELRHQGFMGI